MSKRQAISIGTERLSRWMQLTRNSRAVKKNEFVVYAKLSVPNLVKAVPKRLPKNLLALLAGSAEQPIPSGGQGWITIRGPVKARIL